MRPVAPSRHVPGTHSEPGSSQVLYPYLLVDPSLPVTDKAQRRGPGYRGSQNGCIAELGVNPKASTSQRLLWPPENRSLSRKTRRGLPSNPLSRSFSFKTLGFGDFYECKVAPHL